MPRFCAFRDCLGFHAAHEGLVGLVGQISDSEVALLVHHYPGAIYKASFNTPDQAVQWLWDAVNRRAASQDLGIMSYSYDIV